MGIVKVITACYTGKFCLQGTEIQADKLKYWQFIINTEITTIITTAIGISRGNKQTKK